MKLYWNSKDDILRQVQSEYAYGFESIENTREQRREDLKLYFDAEADDSKVRIRTIFQNHRMLMAIAWANRPKIVWKRRRIGDYERAENCNRAMKFDYKEMWMGVHDYEMESDRFLKGVWVQVSDGFSIGKLCPKICTVDALCWIPDPDGGPTINSHRFAGFEVKMTRWDMEKLWYENIDKTSSREFTDTEIKEKEANGVQQVIDDTPNKLYDVYIHFTIIDGKKYRIVTNWQMTDILTFEYLRPVMQEEKIDESEVPFPIALKYYFYIKGRPLGLSVPDLNRDSQSAISKLFNLYLAMAYRNTFGGDRVVRVDQLLDPSSLETPTIEGKDIPVVETAPNLQDIIYELPRESTNAIPSNMLEMLRQNAENIIGAGSVQQGIAGQNDATLGELQMAQQNGNIQFLLMENIGVWGEEDKWKNLWYRQYVANMKSGEKKEIALSEGYTDAFYVFKKDDFVGNQMLSLEVISAGQAKQDKQTNKAGKIFILQNNLATAKTQTEKNIIMREWMQLEEMDESIISTIAPKTMDEINAERKLVLINAGYPEGARIDSMDDDHYAFIRIFNTADNNDIKTLALSRRYEAIAASGQLQEQQQLSQNGNSGLNASTAQMASQMMQGTKEQPSLQTVVW